MKSAVFCGVNNDDCNCASPTIGGVSLPEDANHKRNMNSSPLLSRWVHCRVASYKSQVGNPELIG